MGAKLIQWSQTNIEDKNGVLRPLRGCPVSRLGELEEVVKRAWQMLGWYPDVRIIDLLHNSEEIRNLHTKALTLCGLDPDWFDVDMVVQLLHQYTTQAGVLHYGLLIEQNLPHLCVVPVDRQLLNEEIEKSQQLLNEATELLEGLTNATSDSI